MTDSTDTGRDVGDVRPVVLDLFCGAGGMSLGFQMAGYTFGLGVDSNPLACQTHAHNFDGRCVQADIATIADPESFVRSHGLERLDVMIGGLPCYAFRDTPVTVGLSRGQ